MSAYICDPSTIDYLVTWATNQRDLSAWLSKDCPASEYDARARNGQRFHVRNLTPDEIGQILLDENVRSVLARYEQDTVDSAPGPCDKSRVTRYVWQAVHHQLAPWVIKACDCLRYQSCETVDYEDSLAFAVMQAIRESAINHLTVDAPWGADAADVAKHMAEIRAKTALALAQERGDK